jgi:hypothetical protein
MFLSGALVNRPTRTLSCVSRVLSEELTTNTALPVFYVTRSRIIGSWLEPRCAPGAQPHIVSKRSRMRSWLPFHSDAVGSVLRDSQFTTPRVRKMWKTHKNRLAFRWVGSVRLEENLRGHSGQVAFYGISLNRCAANVASNRGLIDSLDAWLGDELPITPFSGHNGLR